MSRKIIFITGGARSGKSSFAMAEASKIKGNKAYIATAEALDKEMKERIEKHKQQRGKDWGTYEEPLKIVDVIKEIEDKHSAIVIDCLTLWLSNMMQAGWKIENGINNFIDVLRYVGVGLPRPYSHKTKGGPRPAPTIYIVSNEVGMGIVPENELARKFRDMAGMLNQRVAEVSDEVYLVVAGIPIKIKSSK